MGGDTDRQSGEKHLASAGYLDTVDSLLPGKREMSSLADAASG